MPKHRSTVFTVVREVFPNDDDGWWQFSGLVGTYETTQRADEVAAATIQAYLDAGMDPEFPAYRCTVHANTWYEE